MFIHQETSLQQSNGKFPEHTDPCKSIHSSSVLGVSAFTSQPQSAGQGGRGEGKIKGWETRIPSELGETAAGPHETTARRASDFTGHRTPLWEVGKAQSQLSGHHGRAGFEIPGRHRARGSHSWPSQTWVVILIAEELRTDPRGADSGPGAEGRVGGEL